MPLGCATAPRSLLGVKNLCDFLLAAGMRGNGTLHVADADDCSVADLLEMMTSGSRIHLWRIPKSTMRTLLTLSGRAGVFNRLFEPLQLDSRRQSPRSAGIRRSNLHPDPRDDAVVPATLILLIGGFVATLLLEWLVLRVVRHYQLLAIPNARSSHVDATPTLGGIAIVLTVCAYLISQVNAGVDPAVGLCWVVGCWPLSVCGDAFVI